MKRRRRRREPDREERESRSDGTAASDPDSTSSAAPGTALIDWIADYLAHPERFPVLARVAPGEIAAALPAAPPAKGEPLDAHPRRLRARSSCPASRTGTTPASSPTSPTPARAPGILGELLAAALNVNAHAVADLAGGDRARGGGARAGCASSLGLPAGALRRHQRHRLDRRRLLALAAARESAAAGCARRRASPAGPGRSAARSTPRTRRTRRWTRRRSCSASATTTWSRSRPTRDFRHGPRGARAAIVATDRAAGRRPFAVVATVGTTSTTSVDPVRGDRRHRARATACGCTSTPPTPARRRSSPELRCVLDGCERADSLVVNPHKWLFTPIDCSALYTPPPGRCCSSAFSLVPEYLRTAEATRCVNLMDYGVQLGRRFRALKLWFVLRAFGTDGLARASCASTAARAARSPRRVDADPDLERLAPAPFSVVCLRARPRDLAGREASPRSPPTSTGSTPRSSSAVNRTGRGVPVAHPAARHASRSGSRSATPRTGEAHVRRAEELILAAAAESDREGRAGRGI